MSTELKPKDDTTDFNHGCIRLRSVQLVSRYLLFVEEYDIGREKELKDLTSEVLILKIKTLRPHLHSYNGCTY